MRAAQHANRAALAGPTRAPESSDAVSRVTQSVLALKKRVLEIEELLAGSQENGVDIGAASRKQKGCTVRLLGLENDALFKEDKTHPLLRHVADIRTRLEATEQRMEALRIANGFFSPIPGNVRLRKPSANDAGGLADTVADDAEFSPLRDAANDVTSPAPSKGQAGVEDDRPHTPSPLAGSTELENAKLALKRMEDDIRAKDERLNQLETRLAVKALSAPSNKGAAPSATTSSSTKSARKVAPPSPPSMEKKRPPQGTGVHDNTTVILNRQPVSPIMAHHSYASRELNSLSRIFHTNTTLGNPTAADDELAAMRERLTVLERENAGLRNQVDKVAELRRDADAQIAQLAADKAREVADALQSGRSEVARLGRLLEDEIARSRVVKKRMDEELKEARRVHRNAIDTELTSMQQQRSRSNSNASLTPRQSHAAPQQQQQPPPLQMPEGKYVIGLTGNKCSGKAAVAAMLQELGATVVDADRLLLELQAPGTPTYRAMVDALGVEVLEGATPGAPIQRDELARVVFGDANKMHALERIMHPAMAEASFRRIQDAKSDVVVYLAAKLFDRGRPELFNATWVVWADRDVLVQRLAAKEGITKAEAERKVDAQPAQSSKMARASVLLSNCTSLGALKAQVVRAWSVVPTLSQDAEPPQRLLGRLVALDGNIPNCELREGARVSFGRDPLCTVVLADVTVSHLQCRIKCKRGEFWLQDFSTNGTYINMKKVGKDNRVQLQHGDTVWLSKAVLKTLPKTTRMAYLFQSYDAVASQTLYFPGPKHVQASRLEHWVKRESRRDDGQGVREFWFNTVTGAIAEVDPTIAVGYVNPG